MSDEPFPERVHYEDAEGTNRIIEDWAAATKLLSYFGPPNRYFAIFTLPGDSYVQCYGSKSALNVEARVLHEDGRFTHFRFGRGPLRAAPAGVGPANGPNGERVTIDESQVLALSDAEAIIKRFLFERSLHSDYQLEDVTAAFPT